MVRQFRQLFENEMTEVLTGLVEETTGRTVVNYQSQIMFDPDIIVEMFVFADPRRDGIEATAEGQLEEEATGAVPDAHEHGPHTLSACAGSSPFSPSPAAATHSWFAGRSLSTSASGVVCGRWDRSGAPSPPRPRPCST